MSSPTDEELDLIDDILVGKFGAARRFYERYCQAVKTYVSLKTKRIEDAEEIVQDVFLSAIESLGIYAGRSGVVTWLYGIARHEISDYYRKKRVKMVLLSSAPILSELLGNEDWAGQFDKVAVKMQVMEVMARLLPRYAKVLRMKYLEGWSIGDISENFKESYKSTETALFRARKAFVLEWGNLYGETSN